MRDRRVLVAGNRDEAAWSVELPIETIELGVELVRDLEVVALMADEIAERLVARVLEVVTGAVGADRLLALSVEVAPPRRSPQMLGNDERIRFGQRDAGRIAKEHSHRAARRCMQAGNDDRRAVGRNTRGQALEGSVCAQRNTAGKTMHGIAAGIVGADAQLERLGDAAQRRQHSLPDAGIAGDEVERRLAGDVAVHHGAERIDLDAYLEALLAHGRRAPAGSPLRAVAEHERERVALAKRLAHDVDADRLEPGPERTPRVVFDEQLGAIRRRRRTVVGRARSIELRPPGIAREAEQEAYAALVVDAELARRVDDVNRRHRARDRCRVSLDSDMTQGLGPVGQLADVRISRHGLSRPCTGALRRRCPTPPAAG